MMLMLFAGAQIDRLVVPVLDMHADNGLVERTAGFEIGDVEHRMAGADDVERRVEDVFRNGHGFLGLVVVPGRVEDANPEPRDSGFSLREPRNDGIYIPSFCILCVPRASETCLVSM
jgi:hypothetical protein